MTACDEQLRLEVRIDDWLFAMLRFATTLRASDRTATLTLARMLDMSGVPGSARFSFFERTSLRLCAAISDRDAPESDAVLRRHIARIENGRLTRAFAAATGLDRDIGHRPALSDRRRTDLWRGLGEPRRFTR